MNKNIITTISTNDVLSMLCDRRRKVKSVSVLKIEETHVVIEIVYATTYKILNMSYADAVELDIYHKYLSDEQISQLSLLAGADEELLDANNAEVNRYFVEAFREAYSNKKVEEDVEIAKAEDFEYNMTEADYDDAEELRLIAEYNKMHSDDFRSYVNNISEAANEGLNNVFGYVSGALDNLITAVQDLPDPYLNMMYADEDFEAFINYDPSDNYYVDDFAECYAA